MTAAVSIARIPGSGAIAAREIITGFDVGVADRTDDTSPALVSNPNPTMKNLIVLKLIFLLTAVHAFAFDPPHTPEQIQQQKNLANQQVIEGVPAEFRTPLVAFEKFYAGLVAGDASIYSCLTEKAIEARVGPGELTPEELQRIRDGIAEREERDHLLGEFVFKADPERPEITFGFRYTFKGPGGERITRVERMRIVFTRTQQGWKIDEINYVPPA